MQRWKFLSAIVLASLAAAGCSSPSGSSAMSPVVRAFDARSTGNYSFRVLHTFEGGRDGAEPAAAVLLLDGAAYGTTVAGGSSKGLLSPAASNDSGTIYKIGANGKYAVLYRFEPHMPLGQRALPDGGLVNDSAGNFYGTTNEGGSSFKGTVFKLGAHRRVSTLHTFTGYGDGEYPYAGVVRDAAGNLYGTTEAGGGSGCNGAGCGTVFKVDTQKHESILYAFAGGTDGCVPYGGLVRDRRGNLYGTTTECGAANCPIGYDCGIAFKIDPHGHETILYRFDNTAGGLSPFDTLLLGSDGDLYGTTEAGGTSYFYGLIFKIDKRGNETVLYNFLGGSDGANPFGGLIQDAAGNLYGTTELGGGYNCADGNGCGTVFKLDTNGKETILHRFTGKSDGMEPMADLALDPAGNLYGTTEYGGDDQCNNGLGCGVAFTLKP